MENISFKEYPAERLIINSINSRLLATEREVRREIMDRIINKCGPVSVDSILEHLAGKGIEAASVIESLIKKNVIVVSNDGRINFVYPVSALPTSHKVTLADGRELSAMCAIDAMGVAFTFKQDTIVQSVCKQCAQPISINIRDGSIIELSPFTAHILHVDLNNAANWAGNC